MSTPPPAPAPYKPRFVDIGINLTDPVYTGTYHSHSRHPSDLSSVLSRARAAGCAELIITGSDLPNSHAALALCALHPSFLYSTIGIHPCSTQSFDRHPSGPQGLLSDLRALLLSAPASVVAIGEIGLDYDRLSLSPRETQRTYFAAQLDLAASLPGTPPPLFLHSRAAHEDFMAELNARAEKLPRRGVVHSFTGTLGEMRELVEAGWDVGINGCSIRAEEGVEVVRALPLGSLHVETDGPWCEMRPTHASAAYVGKGYGGEKGAGEDVVADGILERESGYKWVKKEKWVEGALVKGRNEPCMIGRVVVAIARIKGVSVEEVAEAAYKNSVKMFGFREDA